ncbi:MAG TPA: hypothetical protein VM142_10990 [Acidimicrobiales bacterium]|nr:hypothetical protein [Acidimicrobiales bacterium]
MAATQRRRRAGLWALGVVTLAVVVALVVARATGPRQSDDATPTRSAAATPARVAPAVSGSAVPAPPLGASAADNPGPRTSDAGVPVGFARSENGAVAAATTYLSSLHGLALGEAGARERAVRRMAADAAPGIVDQTIASMVFLDTVVGEARAALPSARAFLREIPVAYRLSRFDPARAEVEVWSLGIVLIEGRTQATEVWSTNLVELAWEGDDWRLWSWSRTPGPVPAVSLDAPTDPAEVLAAINGWEGYRYVPST